MPSNMQQSKDITGMDEENYKGQPAVPPNQRKISRSYFTKKLERKLAEDEVEIPRSLFVLMDTPFDDFSGKSTSPWATLPRVGTRWPNGSSRRP
jgi:hypothetical protein